MGNLDQLNTDGDQRAEEPRLTAEGYALVEDVSEGASDELPELRRLSVWEVISHRIRDAFTPSGERLTPKDVLRRAPGVFWRGCKYLIRLPVVFFGEKLDELAGWVEIQKALVRHRRRRRERIRNLSKIRNQHILRMLEEDPLAFDHERPSLKGRELWRWYWLSFLNAVYSRLEVLRGSPKKGTNARKANRSAAEDAEKGKKPAAEAKESKGLAQRWHDYWANATRKESHGLFVHRKDSKLRLSREQWRKLESVYTRARRLMNQGSFEEAAMSFESCVQLLGRNTGDAIYEGLGQCKLAIFESEAPKKPLEWIKQESHDVAFCFQQAAWVNPANKMHSRRAAEAQHLGLQWEDNHRQLNADIDRLGYEMGQLEQKHPDHAGLAAARRELYNAKVSLSVWGYADAEKIVLQCREILDGLR